MGYLLPCFTYSYVLHLESLHALPKGTYPVVRERKYGFFRTFIFLRVSTIFHNTTVILCIYNTYAMHIPTYNDTLYSKDWKHSCRHLHEMKCEGYFRVVALAQEYSTLTMTTVLRLALSRPALNSAEFTAWNRLCTVALPPCCSTSHCSWDTHTAYTIFTSPPLPWWNHLVHAPAFGLFYHSDCFPTQLFLASICLRNLKMEYY